MIEFDEDSGIANLVFLRALDTELPVNLWELVHPEDVPPALTESKEVGFLLRGAASQVADEPWFYRVIEVSDEQIGSAADSSGGEDGDSGISGDSLRISQDETGKPEDHD